MLTHVCMKWVYYWWNWKSAGLVVACAVTVAFVKQRLGHGSAKAAF
jgi:hypothetical protein